MAINTLGFIYAFSIYQKSSIKNQASVVVHK